MIHGHLLGLYEKALPPEWAWEKRLLTAKELGFDYMEISIDESDERIERLFWDKHQRRKLLEICKDLDIPLLSMCLSTHRRFPFGSADSATRKKARELMERAISFSEDLGIRVIQLAGYDVYYEKSTSESLQHFIDGLKWSSKLAERNQVMLAMEIMDTELMNSITKSLWYEEQVGSPWYKLYPDVGNLSAWGNNVEDELEKGISSIVSIHLKDTKAVTKDFKGQFKCVPFGEGCVDFAGCFAKLEELHYTGRYLVEMWNDPSIDNEDRILHSVKFLEEEYSKALAK